MRSVKKSYFPAAHAGEKSMTEKSAVRKIRLFPGAARFSEIPDFRGMNRKTQSVISRKRGPRGKELPAEDKIFNKMISGVRVIAEHVISGVKRLRIVRDVPRNTKDGFGDPVMETACGLHNLRVTFRVPKHPKKDPEPLWH